VRGQRRHPLHQVRLRREATSGGPALRVATCGSSLRQAAGREALVGEAQAPPEADILGRKVLKRGVDLTRLRLREIRG
jgi:hypothetical protein